MLIFYAWVVLLAAIIISVPVVYVLENKKNKGAQGPALPAAGEMADAGFIDETGGDVEIADEMAGFGEESPAGGDDFSAFDEEFK